MRASSVSRVKTGAILLVDDNRHGLVARKALLQEQGHSITTVSSGEEGLEALASGRFDLIITDFRMPKMNGIELIRHLKKTAPDLPVILLSGFVEALGLDEKSTGADIVVAKGANEVAHLLRAVSRIMNRATPKKPPASQKSPLRTKARGV
ncbi:MAG: response regulator [Candidatus Solibacter usitatus]|nr:response regulator [Candidatus Solibacter usitatus]